MKEKEEIVVDVSNLCVIYDEKPVLWQVNVSIKEGDLVAIVGPNGAGKTTFIKSLMGLVKPIAGKINIFGSSYKEVKKRIAYVPQKETVDWDFPAEVIDIVMMGRYGHLGWFKRPGEKEQDMAFKVLEKVGMVEFAKKQINELSGGQQQRVFLARALIQEADIYFMDEPFVGVDAQSEKTIVKILKSMQEEGKTILVVHHDLQTLKEYFQSCLLINVKKIGFGKVSEIVTNEYLQKAYQPTNLILEEILTNK